MWSWQAFFDYFSNRFILDGAVVTLLLTVTTLALGFLLGLVLATMRMSSLRVALAGRSFEPLAGFAKFYIWVFRGTPLLVQLIIIYTGLPQLGFVRLNVTQSAIIGLVLNEAAYLSEILRAGILSVPKGQTEAALSLGLSRWRTFRLVVLPQAMRVIVPPLGNSVNGLLKTTSIASVISMEELVRSGQLIMQYNLRYVLEIYIVIACIYLMMTTGWDFAQRRIEAYFGRGYGEAEAQALARDDR
jgi:polar amino acid transport system permease protein